jgi:dATP pyrophosphohydrolase
MPRAPINILVLPFRLKDKNVEYAILKRADKGLYGGIWQFISGGAEDDETKEDALRREAFEEAGIPQDSAFYRLDTFFTVPRFNFAVTDHWPKNLYSVPNYCFAVNYPVENLILSHEHSEYKWCSYDECFDKLYFLSNKNAMWELHSRLINNDMIPV